MTSKLTRIIMKLSNSHLLLILLVSTLIISCKDNVTSIVDETKATKETIIFNPADDLGKLFEDIQLSGLYPDSKLFVDATLKTSVDTILRAYESQKIIAGFDLRNFVEAHFSLPMESENTFKSDTTLSLEQHIEKLWDVLKKDATPMDIPTGSLLPLQEAYVVPGGRFREIYYWDSYFTMLGLAESGRIDMIQSMIDNFAYMIDTYGHIPNGSRSYYLSRSQPPFFTSMVQLLSDLKGELILGQYLPQIEKEYEFWMEGAITLKEGECNRRVCNVNGTLINRYYDDKPAPRPEAYKEDVEVAKSSKDVTKTYLDLKAGAESGWDYSTRWFADAKTLKTIHTTDILPIDLNSLIFNTEKLLSDVYRSQNNTAKATLYLDRAINRQTFINEIMVNKNGGFYADVILDGTPTNVPSLAMMYPLYFGVAEDEHAEQTLKYIKKNFMKSGGLPATLNKSGQQWDYPNGWAPLQWISFKAFENYGYKSEAAQLAQNWTALNERVYKRTGKMLEKYNVVNMSLIAGGGEYPVQDGFGWSNGVYLAMKNWLKKQ